MNNYKLKIAILDLDSLRSPFWRAGQARATREVGKRLAKNHEISVYTSKFPGYKDYKEDGMLYKHVGIVSKHSKITNAGYILSIPFVVSKIKADVIIECFTAPISTLFSPLFTKVPVVGLPTMFNAEEFTKKYHLPFHWIEQVGMRFYKYLLPYSDVDSQKAVRLNPKIKYKIVPQGVGNEYFKIKHEKPQYILYLGRFDISQKGIDLLLEAYSLVKDRIKYPLVLAGHGSDKRKIMELMAKLGLEKDVKIIGPTYGNKKSEVISKALFIAFPSRHEEMSLWSLEALASGLPLVVFDLPEHRWIKDEVVLRAKPFDVHEYASLLIKASSRTYLARRQHLARKFAKKFTWENVAEKFEKFFYQILIRNKEQGSFIQADSLVQNKSMYNQIPNI